MSENFLKIIQFWQHSEAQKIFNKLHHAVKISFGKKKNYARKQEIIKESCGMTIGVIFLLSRILMAKVPWFALNVAAKKVR